MKISVKTSLERSRKIPAAMKIKIKKYLNSSSKCSNGIITGLKQPKEIDKKLKNKRSGDCCSLGADGKGFFVYTHRARSKSYSDPLKIPKKDIEFIGETA